MNDPEPIDPRRRIRELSAIPERDRTDEQWDELNELEIRTAPGNRESNGQVEKRPNPAGQARRPDRNQGPKNAPRADARPQEARTDGRPPAKRQHRRPKRPAETPSGGGSGGNGGSGGSGGNSGNSGNSGNGGASGAS
jgi:uncharacterized membrane protein YgcG